jgi:polyisoprenyl-phosphate glycosyltransferase
MSQARMEERMAQESQNGTPFVGQRPRPLLSVVVPVYNEIEVLPQFHSRLSVALRDLPVDVEILYVNDGSTDATASALRVLRETDARIGIIDLSRNFGKEIAMTAGLDHAKGDAVVIIDADLQDPPEIIPQFVRDWQDGNDVVYGTRASRCGETRLKRFTSYAFYRVIQRLSRVQIPADTGDFRLLSRRAVDALRSLREQHRFMKGLFAWIGYPQKAVVYHRDSRYAGRTKWNYFRLWAFALEGITSFSTAPLKLATYLGLLTSVTALAYGAIIVAKTLIFGDTVRGYPSLVTIVLFLGGIQLIGLGVLGEYVGRMFDEVKRRPLYLIRSQSLPCLESPRQEVLAWDRSAKGKSDAIAS